MSYDAVLTEAEFAKFTPNAEVVRYLELTRKRLGLQKSSMNVLDWGSGRGEYVTWLRAAGYNAFGAEIRQAYRDARNVVSYIAKPFKPQVVTGIVAEVLAKIAAGGQEGAMPWPEGPEKRYIPFKPIAILKNSLKVANPKLKVVILPP